MKLILCLAAVAAASPLLDEHLEARAEPNVLGQPMGPMAGPGDVTRASGGSTKQPSSTSGRPTLSSLLEKLDTLLGGSIAVRDLGDMEELEELIARAKIESGISSTFRPINRTPIREPLGGGISPNLRIGTIKTRDIDNFEDSELLARAELQGAFRPVNHFPVRRPIGGGKLPDKIPALSMKSIARRNLDDFEEFEFQARGELEGGFAHPRSGNKFPIRKGPISDRPRPKFRIGEMVKSEGVQARDLLDDELWY